MKHFDIHSVNRSLETAIQAKIDNLNKPKGALGRLEEIAMQVSLIQESLTVLPTPAICSSEAITALSARVSVCHPVR